MISVTVGSLVIFPLEDFVCFLCACLPIFCLNLSFDFSPQRVVFVAAVGVVDFDVVAVEAAAAPLVFCDDEHECQGSNLRFPPKEGRI